MNALFSPLTNAPNQAIQNKSSTKFVFYFVPVLEMVMRRYAYTRGCLFLLLFDSAHPCASPYRRLAAVQIMLPADLWADKEEENISYKWTFS